MIRVWYTRTPALMLVWCLFAIIPPRAIADETEEAISIRVLSYNIHHAEGVDRKLDLERIARVIGSAHPDIVALQEVDQGTARTRSVDQPKELARLTGMHVAFGRNIGLQGGGYGNAVLSKHAIKRQENHALPCFDKGEQRGVLEVEIELPKLTESLIVLATHLDHRGDDRERVASAKELNEFVSKAGKRPMILAGDFNDVEESETFKLLQTKWTCTNSKPIPTIPVDKPARQIDFVFHRPAENWRVINVEALDEAIASDHRAILATMELRVAPGRHASTANKR